MLIELRMASFTWLAFWKIDADIERSFLALVGGPRAGNSGGDNIGVEALVLGFEFVPVPPERRPEEELDVELRELFTLKLVGVLGTWLVKFIFAARLKRQANLLRAQDMMSYDNSVLPNLKYKNR